MKNQPNLTGTVAPRFAMTDINGRETSSANTRGKVVVLNFWFAACKPCIAEIPELNQVHEQYHSDTNVVFAAITFASYLGCRPTRPTLSLEKTDKCTTTSQADLRTLAGPYPVLSKRLCPAAKKAERITT